MYVCSALLAEILNVKNKLALHCSEINPKLFLKNKPFTFLQQTKVVIIRTSHLTDPFMSVVNNEELQRKVQSSLKTNFSAAYQKSGEISADSAVLQDPTNLA